MTPYAALVQALRAVRRERGWTAEEVSLRMGRSPTHVSGLESTRKSGYGGPHRGRDRSDGPTLRVLVAVAEGHGLTLAELGARMDRALRGAA